jgi:glycosyltransferase involved in cell wall biosynthesis
VSAVKKVCHISSVHQATDVRILYKECTSLAAAGFETYLVAMHPRKETINGVHIIPVNQPAGGRLKRMTGTVSEVYKKAIEVDAELYHFHDPELMALIPLLKAKGKKVVYDVHENLPHDIYIKDWLGPQWFRRLLSGVVSLVEELAEKGCDAIVTVTPEIIKRFKPGTSVLLRNFPSIKVIDEVKPAEARKGSFTFIYAGGLTYYRGIKDIIAAVGKVQQPCELWLIGNWESEAFKAECMSMEGFIRCKYLGFINPEEVYAYMKMADAGLALLHPTEAYVTSYPVKAFEYMACGLPMIMSGFPLWKEMFEGAALFAEAKNIESISGTMEQLASNKMLLEELSNNARYQVENKYSWEAEAVKLIDLYNKLLS